MSTGHFGSRYLKGQSFEEKLDFYTLIFNHGVFSAAFAPLCCGGCLHAFFGMLLGAIAAVRPANYFIVRKMGQLIFS